MPERHIHAFKAVFPDPSAEKESMAPLLAELPPRAARRMSCLGILMHHVLREMPLGPQTTLVYTTTFAEARALETYLQSLPEASPTAFQTSIHPGGVEQALILRQQPLGPFVPLAGLENLFLNGLQCSLTAGTPDVVLCGGEEQGTWLQEYGLSHSASYAWAIHLSGRATGSLGKARWDPDDADTETSSRHPAETIQRLLVRQNLDLAKTDLGRFTISWH